MDQTSLLIILSFVLVFLLAFIVFIYRAVKGGHYRKPWSEPWQIATIFVITLVLALGSIYVLDNYLSGISGGTLTWDSYDATLYDNGTFTEQITSDVTSNGEYHMLFRYWADPLYISPSER